MRDLTPVGMSQDNQEVVLTDNDGAEFSVPLNELREALHKAGNDTPPAEPTAATKEQVSAMAPEPKPESSLRPRDIQSRIRTGETAEHVAEIAGISIDRVMIFAAPVLAERAHVAQVALNASVRRRSPDPISSERTLGVAAATRLRDEGVDPESVDWDSWRRDDGRWTLKAAYHHDGKPRSAHFVYDQPGKFVAADDDEGRWLVGDGKFSTRAEKELARKRRQPTPRYDEQLPLGDDAIELVSGEHPHPDAPAPETPRGDADWIAPVEDVTALRATEKVAVAKPDQPAPEQPAPAEPQATVEDEPTVEPQAAVEDEPTDTTDELTPIGDFFRDSTETAPPPPDPGVTDAADEPASTDSTTDSADDSTTAAPAKPKGRKNRRASVPSWDEIMFGGGN